MVNELELLSWARRRSNPLWIVVRRFEAEMEEKTHDGADAWTSLAERQLADHPEDMTPLRQQMGLSLDPGHH